MSAPVPAVLSTLEILAKLVSFDTDSAKSNLGLIGWVESYLAGHGVPFLRLPNPAGDKAALIASIGPAERPGIVLSGHSDVVPVTGQSWSSDPFTLRVAGGRAYGRGAVDMKGFLAICLAAVPELAAARLRTPIHLFFSYDEETTCLGVMDGIARFGRAMPMPQAVIVGEPTDLEVADAHKSVFRFQTTAHGHEAHSSKPALGANAVTMAALLIAELAAIEEELRRRGDPSGRFDPAYTTVQACLIEGGTISNILARACAFEWEFRGLPSLDPDEIPGRLAAFAETAILPRYRHFGPHVRVETRREVAVPGLAPAPGSPAETLALGLSGRNRTITVPYGTEAGNFQLGGAPTVVCGPGSINQAHQPDEYITLKALADGEAWIRRLAAWCARN